MKSCSMFAKARKTLAYVLRFNNNTKLKAKKRRHFTRRIERLQAVVMQMESIGNQFKYCGREADSSFLRYNIVRHHAFFFFTETTTSLFPNIAV